MPRELSARIAEMAAASRLTKVAAAAVLPDHGFPDALRRSAATRTCVTGEAVFRTGTRTHSVFYIETGRVRLVRFGAHGEEVALHDARAGEFFAEASLDSAHYHCDAIAAEPTQLLQVPAAAIRELLATDPVFVRRWVSLLAGQLRKSRARVERLSLKGARERVLHLLVSEGHGTAPAVALQGTVKDLARELGLTHEVLYRTLAAMSVEGLIERDGETIRLLK
jgi:CRP/FNR family transcriptional regulator, dissimilatory nitrate respiration regulator